MPAACPYSRASVPRAQQISSHSRRDVPQDDSQAQQQCGSSGRSQCGTNFNPRKVFPPVWQAKRTLSQASIMDEGFKRLSALDPSKSNLLRDKC